MEGLTLKRLVNPKDDDISLSHILFNHDPSFYFTLIPLIGIIALIELVCGKPNPFIFTCIFDAIRYMALAGIPHEHHMYRHNENNKKNIQSYPTDQPWIYKIDHNMQNRRNEAYTIEVKPPLR